MLNWFFFILIPISGPETDFNDFTKAPPTRQQVQMDTYHGQEVIDPYRWLEAMQDPEVKEWVKAQDRHARQMVMSANNRAKLRYRLKKVSEFHAFGAAIQKRSNLFYSQRLPGVATSKILVQKGLDGKATTLVDQKELPKDHEIRQVSPSTKGHLLAYAVSQQGSRWATVRIRNVKTGKDLDDVLVGYQTSFSAITWSQDEKCFYYDKLRLPQEGGQLEEQLEPLGIYRHRLGDDQSNDELIYRHPQHDLWYFSHQLLDTQKKLIVNGSYKDRRTIQVVDLEQSSKHPILIADVVANLNVVGSNKNTIYAHTTHEAANGRVVAFDIATPQVIKPLIDESNRPIAGVTYAAHHFFVSRSKDAVPFVDVYDENGDHSYQLEPPRSGSIWIAPGDRDTQFAFYNVSNLANPGTIYKLDPKTGKSVAFRAPKLAYEPSDFKMRQVFYRTKDGTAIPMFLVHKKGLNIDQPSPVFMYGYGAGNWSAYPWFQPHMVVWMEMGGIYAMPGLRGGGEYGKDWNDAGIKLNKQNGIDDFIAAAEFLIEQKITQKSMLAINGGSASGPTAGALLCQRPDLIGAALIEWPALDMLRFDRFTGGQYWTWNNGSPENELEFENLKRFSPYHNLKKGVCYPPTMIVIGENDESTVPMHGYKFIARMNEMQGCSNPILLHTIWGGGHYQYGVTAEASLDTWADELAFLCLALNLTPPPELASVSRP